MTRRFTRRPSPGVYSVSCDACDFGLHAMPARAFVLGPEDRRLYLPLPFRLDSVEQETGRTWGEIVRTSDVVVELAGVCLGCGDLNFILRASRESYVPSLLTSRRTMRWHIASLTNASLLETVPS